MLLKALKIYTGYARIEKQLEVIAKNVSKYGKYIEELDKEVAILKTNSHPPIFTKDQVDSFEERLRIIEAFFENIEKITNESLKDIAN